MILNSKTISIFSLILLQFLLMVDNCYGQGLSDQQSNITNDMINLLSGVDKYATNNLNKTITPSQINNSNQLEPFKLIENKLFSTNNQFQTLLLDKIRIPDSGLLHIYDFYPYKVIKGQIEAKLPCSQDDAAQPITVMVGNISSLQTANLIRISDFTDSTELCFYTSNIDSTKYKFPITDIFIKNNSTGDINFPPTSSFIFRVQSLNSTEINT